MLLRVALSLTAMLALPMPLAAQLIEDLPDAVYITRCPGPMGEEKMKSLPVANTSLCDRAGAFSWNFGDPPMASSATVERLVSAEAFSSRPRVPADMPEELIPLFFPILSEPFVVAAVVEAVAEYELTGPLLPPPPGANSAQTNGSAAVEASAGSSGCDLSDAVVLARVVGAPGARAPGIAPVCAEVTSSS